jgi:hypothetical protein
MSVPSLLPPLDPSDRVTAPPSLPAGVPPLGLPSDGEASPSFPDLPDLPNSLPPVQADGDTAVPAEAEGDPNPQVKPEREVGRSAATPFAEWHHSPRTAAALSAQQNRCMLLVFSSGQSVPDDVTGRSTKSLSHVLSDEVFANAAFNDFALEHLVLASLDYSSGSLIKNEGEVAHDEALALCKQRLKVHGFPTAILFGPDGKEITRWNGYATDQKSGKGRAPARYLQNLKQAVLGYEAVLFQSQRRREKLASEGFRDWTSAQGSILFAKLIEFDASCALLRDESGQERKVDLRQLDIADREFITRKRLGKPPFEIK